MIRNTGGFSDTVLLNVFKEAHPFGFGIKQWADHNFWTDVPGMVQKFKSPDCNLYGLVTHQPQHWIAHRLQSSGFFVELDSNINSGGSFVAADQVHLTVEAMVDYAEKAVQSGESVFLLFKNPPPRWKNSRSRKATDADLERVDLISSSEKENDETTPSGKLRFFIWKSVGRFHMSLNRCHSGLIKGYEVYHCGEHFLTGPFYGTQKNFTKLEKIAIQIFQESFEEKIFKETNPAREASYDRYESQNRAFNKLLD
jgi:hypothetical protein